MDEILQYADMVMAMERRRKFRQLRHGRSLMVRPTNTYVRRVRALTRRYA